MRLLIPLALFLSSAASMALEIVAGRLLAPYVGMSLYSWTAIIAVVLGGLAIGHWIGGVRADRARSPALELMLILAAASATTALVSPLLRALSPATLAAFDPVTAIGVLSLALFFAPSLLAGALSPLLTMLALQAAPVERHGRVLGRMYALGAGGAIAGTLVSGYVMIAWIGSSLSVLSVAGLYAVLALAFAPGARARTTLALAALVAGGLLRLGAPEAWAGLSTSPCWRESAYFCIRVDDASGITGRESRVMALDHLGHGVNDRAEPTLIHSAYVQLVDELARRRFAGRNDLSAFFVGGGAYTLPRAWLAEYPAARLVTAEIDPEVSRAAMDQLWLPADPRHEILHQDARLALAMLPEGRRFDVIFGDAFKDVAIPQHLVTDEFHAQVTARLKPGGLYVINVVDALWRPPFLLSLTRTLQARFRHVGLWLAAEELSREERRVTWIVTASDTDDPAREIHASRPPRRTWVRVPTERMLGVIPESEQVFLTDDYTPVDRLMRHILMDKRLAE